MNIPFLWKLRIEIRHIGGSSTHTEEDWMYCLGYDKEQVQRRIVPVLRNKERNGLQLIIKELWKDKEVHYLTDEVIESILKVNMKSYIEDQNRTEYREKHPSKYSKPSNLSPF